MTSYSEQIRMIRRNSLIKCYSLNNQSPAISQLLIRDVRNQDKKTLENQSCPCEILMHLKAPFNKRHRFTRCQSCWASLLTILHSLHAAALYLKRVQMSATVFGAGPSAAVMFFSFTARVVPSLYNCSIQVSGRVQVCINGCAVSDSVTEHRNGHRNGQALCGAKQAPRTEDRAKANEIFSTRQQCIVLMYTLILDSTSVFELMASLTA